MTSVLILGGTGFIGPQVVRTLVAQGHDVTLYNRGVSPADLPDGVRRIVGSRAEIAARRDDFRAVAPDVVLDMRSMLEPEARTIVETMTDIAPRIVTISSMDVYRAFGLLIGSEDGEPVPVPFDETGPLRTKRYPYRTETPPAPDDPRAWAQNYDKIPIEELVLGADGIAGTILRLPMVYGDGDYQHRPLPYVQRMTDGRPGIILGDRDAGFRAARGYVGNVAAAIALAVTDDRAAGRIFNVTDDRTWTEREWLGHIASAMDWSGEIVIVPQDELPESLRGLGERGQDLWVDATAIRRDLGYRDPFDVNAAMARTVAWEREHLAAEPVDYTAEDSVLAARS
ncbi:MAG: NAD-dependent epimerase/dehydratase family protein [Thermomicrobiales bacterium]